MPRNNATHLRNRETRAISGEAFPFGAAVTAYRLATEQQSSRPSVDFVAWLTATYGAPVSGTDCDRCGSHTSSANTLPDWHSVVPMTVNGEEWRHSFRWTSLTSIRVRTRAARGLPEGARLDGTVDIHLCLHCLTERPTCGRCGYVDVTGSGGTRPVSLPDTVTGVLRTDVLCQSCRDEHGGRLPAVQCRACGVTPHGLQGAAYLLPATDDMGGCLCNSCRVTCGPCGRPGDRYTFARTMGRGWACPTCREDMFVECGSCDGLVETTDENGECPSCARHARLSIIGDYHSSRWGRSHAVPTPWTHRHRGRFFGVELEVEAVGATAPHEAAARVLGAGNAGDIIPGLGRLVHTERDGSLSNGFEIVSRPLDLAGHRALWAAVLRPDVVRGLRSHETTTCGLHVHLTRASLTPLQISRMSVCLNARAWEPLVRGIARRYQTGYCTVSPKRLGRVLTSQCNGKYDALNVSRTGTIEFRIFRGSLNPAAVIAAVEFAHALAEFCAMPSWAPSDASSLSPAAFLAFLALPEMRGDTRTLRGYLLGRGVQVEAKEARPRAASAPLAPVGLPVHEPDPRGSDLPDPRNDDDDDDAPNDTWNLDDDDETF